VKPERNLGELDRHGILVDAKDAAFQDETLDEVLVDELVVADGPAMLLRVGADSFTDR
jgi:hypothetical protein